jgi:hypothetical protein
MNSPPAFVCRPSLLSAKVGLVKLAATKTWATAKPSRFIASLELPSIIPRLDATKRFEHTNSDRALSDVHDESGVSGEEDAKASN